MMSSVSHQKLQNLLDILEGKKVLQSIWVATCPGHSHKFVKLIKFIICFIGAQMKTSHNLRLISCDVFDLCRLQVTELAFDTLSVAFIVL